MIPIQELLHYLGAADGDDDVIAELERNAVAFVEQQTGRYFGAPEVVDEVVSGTGGSRLWLRDMPISVDDDYDGPLALVMETMYTGSSMRELIEGTDFVTRVRDNEGVLVRTNGGVWLRGYEYTVTYWRGYPAGQEPGDIRQLVLDMVATRFRAHGSEGLRSETLGADYSYTRFAGNDLGAMPGAEATLSRWRRPVFA